MDTHLLIYEHICTDTYFYMHIHVYICLFCLHIYIHIHAHVYMYMWTHVHVDVYTHVYAFMEVLTYVFFMPAGLSNGPFISAWYRREDVRIPD